MNIFSEIFEGLPRQGPGDAVSTARALALLTDLPNEPRLLDIGCGSGMQTRVLAERTLGYIVAVDINGTSLAELRRSSNKIGLPSVIAPVRASMSALPVLNESFDAVWSEGAAYIMGFDGALREWRHPLKGNGYVAISELTWLRPVPPKEVIHFWKANYPAMRSTGENLQAIRTSGYRETGHFVLPTSSWWNTYYGPLEERIVALRRKYQHEPQACEQLASVALEIDLFRKHSDCYGYVFYTMRAN